MTDARPYTLLGVTFNATEEAIQGYSCFDPDSPAATDTGPHGMVAEAQAFLRIVERENLRNLVDVGALFGVFSFLFTARPYTLAYAIEASDQAFCLLKEQCALNPARNISAFHRFIGDTMYRAVTLTREWKHVIANLEKPGADQVNMIEQTIDWFDFHAVDCMKIDVEAYECQVLRGAARTIARYRPVIFLEVHTNNLPDNGESAASLMGILRGINYRVEHYDGAEVEDFAVYDMTRVVCWPRERRRVK